MARDIEILLWQAEEEKEKKEWARLHGERIDCEEGDKTGMGPTDTCDANEAVSTRRGATRDARSTQKRTMPAQSSPAGRIESFTNKKKSKRGRKGDCPDECEIRY